MNYEEKLLKNYILSELYNIEKQQFLAENLFKQFDNNLNEGIGSILKSAAGKLKSVFIKKDLIDSLKEKRDKLKKQGDFERAEKLQEKIEDLETKQFRNQSSVIFGSLAVIVVNMFPGNVDKQTEVLTHPAVEEAEAGNTRPVEDLLRRKGLEGYRVSFGQDSYEEDFDSEEETGQEIDYSPIVDQDNVSVASEENPGESYTLSSKQYDYFLNLNADREDKGKQPFTIDEYLRMLNKFKESQNAKQKEKEIFEKALSIDEDGNVEYDYEKLDINSTSDANDRFNEQINLLSDRIKNESDEDIKDQLKSIKSDLYRSKDLLYFVDENGEIIKDSDISHVNYTLSDSNSRLSDGAKEFFKTLINLEDLD